MPVPEDTVWLKAFPGFAEAGIELCPAAGPRDPRFRVHHRAGSIDFTETEEGSGPQDDRCGVTSGISNERGFFYRFSVDLREAVNRLAQKLGRFVRAIPLFVGFQVTEAHVSGKVHNFETASRSGLIRPADSPWGRARK